MALRKDYKKDDGTVVTGYFRVREVHTQYEKERGVDADQALNFRVEVYDEDTGERIDDEGFGRFENGVHSYDLAVPASAQVTSLIDRAYTLLKSLELFSEAEDC